MQENPVAEGIVENGSVATTKSFAQLLGMRFVRSRSFKTLVHETFSEMDVHTTGALDKIDIYCAVLNLYTKLTKSCRNAEPPCRQEVDRLVDTFDSSQRCRTRFTTRFDNKICEAEFASLAASLCERVAVRRVVQSTVSVIAAPIMAKMIEFILDRVTPGSLAIWIPWRQKLRGPRNALVLAMTCAFATPRALDWAWKQRRY